MRSPVLRLLSRRPRSTTWKKIQRSKRSIHTGAWSFLFATKRSQSRLCAGATGATCASCTDATTKSSIASTTSNACSSRRVSRAAFTSRKASRSGCLHPKGVESFPIAGVFYDYTRDQGTVFLSEKNFQKFWHDDRVNSLGLYLKKGADPETVAEAFRDRFSKGGEFSIYSNRLLRTRIFEIFDQTFAVTYVLRTIAVLVAVVGIFLGLTTLVTERSRELGVMRSIGASAAQIRRLLLWESGMIGLLASVLGLASGLCLSLILTGVINRAFFGWTIQLAFPWWSLAWTPIWIIAAAVVAGWIPAWRAGRINIAEAVRSE